MHNYDQQNERIQKIIWIIEERIRWTIPIDEIASKDFLERFSGWYLPSLSGLNPWGRIITVDIHLKGRQLFETVAHEVGHSLLNKRKLSQPLKSLFTTDKEYDARLKTGFFSGYARTDWEADFCETFSAWVVNSGRLNNVVFECRTFNLKRDEVLLAKYMAIKQYLKAKKL